MTIGREMRRLIGDAAPSDVIQDEAIRHGMIEFKRSAMIQVAQGVTSTEEILRDVPPEYLGIED